MEPLESRRLLTATVWIAAVDQNHPAAEGNDYQPGSPQFGIYARFGPEDVGKTLTIPYQVGGTATKPGGTGQVDHDLADGALTLRLGYYYYPAATELGVSAFRDNLVEGNESVVVTLQPGADYALGDPGSGASPYPSPGGNAAQASINIHDDPPVVRIQPETSSAAEPDSVTAASPGSFYVFRSGGDTRVPLTVGLNLGGTANKPFLPGADYSLSANVTVVGAPRSLTPPDRGPLAPPSAPTPVAPLTPPPTPTAAPALTRPPFTPPTRPPFTDATLTIPAEVGPAYTGGVSTSITVTPTSDRLVEGPETVVVTLLASPTNAVFPSLASAAVTIADREPVLQALAGENVNDSSQHAQSDDTTPNPTLVVANPGDPSHARVKLTAFPDPRTPEAYSQTLFTVTGDDGSVLESTQAFAPSGNTFDIDWSAKPIGFHYEVEAGVDKNDNGILEAGEVTRFMLLAARAPRRLDYAHVGIPGTSAVNPLQLAGGQAQFLSINVKDTTGAQHLPASFSYALTVTATGAPVPAGLFVGMATPDAVQNYFIDIGVGAIPPGVYSLNVYITNEPAASTIIYIKV